MDVSLFKIGPNVSGMIGTGVDRCRERELWFIPDLFLLAVASGNSSRFLATCHRCTSGESGFFWNISIEIFLECF